MLGSIPPEPPYSDGQAATVFAGPGGVELLMFPSLHVGENAALIRVCVQSVGAGASVGLAALDGTMDGSIATVIPANSGIYQGRYHRMVLLYDPPGTTIAAVLQVANLPGQEIAMVYFDNLEVYLLPRGEVIPTDLLY